MDNNPHIGSSLDSFLQDEGIYTQVSAKAFKRVLAWQLVQLMQEQALSKQELAVRMRTSRAAVNRLLDPENESITLLTLQRAAESVGKQLRIELVDAS